MLIVVAELFVISIVAFASHEGTSSNANTLTLVRALYARDTVPNEESYAIDSGAGVKGTVGIGAVGVGAVGIGDGEVGAGSVTTGGIATGVLDCASVPPPPQPASQTKAHTALNDFRKLIVNSRLN